MGGAVDRAVHVRQPDQAPVAPHVNDGDLTGRPSLVTRPPVAYWIVKDRVSDARNLFRVLPGSERVCTERFLKVFACKSADAVRPRSKPLPCRIFKHVRTLSEVGEPQIGLELDASEVHHEFSERCYPWRREGGVDCIADTAARCGVHVWWTCRGVRAPSRVSPCGRRRIRRASCARKTVPGSSDLPTVALLTLDIIVSRAARLPLWDSPGNAGPVARAAAWPLLLVVQAFIQPGERVTRSITSSVVNFHGETFDPGCDRPWKSVSLSRRRICRQPKVKSSKNRMRLSHTTSMKARTLWSGDHMGRRSSTMPDSAFLTA